MADEGETVQQLGSDDSAARVGDRWGDDIPADRKAWLESELQTWEAEGNHGEKRGPFDGVKLTGADVYWLAMRSLAGSVDEATITAAKRRVQASPWLYLTATNLEGANFFAAHTMEWAYFREAHLEGANLGGAHLKGALLGGAHLEGANLRGAHLKGAYLREAHLEGADLSEAQLEGAVLGAAHLEEADLRWGHLEGAHLSGAHLAGANLRGAQLEGADLSGARLAEVNLMSATFDKASLLNDATLTGALLDQVTYDGVNLTVVDWSLVPVLGDELRARQRKDSEGKRKSRRRRIDEYTAAVRAYRVLAVTLRSQGMNEDADHYAYRAQRMQRVVKRLRRRFVQYLGSLFIDLLAGYGYRAERSLLVYLAVILWFANFYVWASHGLFSLGLPPTHVQPLAWYEGLILSVSSFHGRGFQPFQNLNDPIAALAGMQAVFGLIIEVSFIATFTQRFFAR